MMNRKIFWLVLLLFPLKLIAQGDCDAALVPEVTEMQTNNTLAVAYLSLVDSSTFDTRKRGGSVGVSVPYLQHLVDVSATYEDFKQKVEHHRQAHSYSLNQEESRAFLQQSVRDTAINAWRDCKLKRREIAVYARNVTAKTLTLRVDWTPAPGVPTPQQVVIALAGGTISEQTTYRERWTGAVEKSYLVTRLPDQDLRVIVNVASISNDILVAASVPPAPRSVITLSVGGWIEYETSVGKTARFPVDQPADYFFALPAPGRITNFEVKVAQSVNGKHCTEALLTLGRLNVPPGTRMDSTVQLRDQMWAGANVPGRLLELMVDPKIPSGCQ